MYDGKYFPKTVNNSNTREVGSFPKTLRALDQVLRINRETDEQNGQIKLYSNQKGSKRRNKRSVQNKKQTTQNRKRRRNPKTSRGGRQRSKPIYQDGNRAWDSFYRRQNYTQNSRQSFGNNSGDNRRSLKKKNETHPYLNNIRRVGYSMPMPFMRPNIKTKRGRYRDRGGNLSDGCVVTGSEFIGSVSVNTTANVQPTQAGDIIYTLFANPILMPGTRLYELALLYQHFKFRRLTLEYVPAVSNTYPGDLGLGVVYDADDPLNLVVGSDVRRREFMSLDGANVGKVMDFLRTDLRCNEDTLLDYFVHPGDNGRQFMQAYMPVMAFTTFDPVTTETTKTLGELIIHYEMELDARSIDRETLPIATTTLTMNNTAANLFTNIAAQNQVAILPAAYTGTLTMRPGYVAVITPLTNFQSPGPVYQAVDTSSGANIRLFSQGSVWFGCVVAPNAGIYIFLDIDDAIDKNTENAAVWVAGGIPAGPTFTAMLSFQIFDIGALPAPMLLKYGSRKKFITHLVDEDDNGSESTEPG